MTEVLKWKDDKTLFECLFLFLNLGFDFKIFGMRGEKGGGDYDTPLVGHWSPVKAVQTLGTTGLKAPKKGKVSHIKGLRAGILLQIQ